jgi:subtilase family serine protease
MTILAPAGDSGAADCDWGDNVIRATHGLAVDLPASLPYVTAMGGTEFNDNSSYWSTTNSTSFGSVLSYLPERAWNDTTGTSPLSAGGGGRSINFSKPAWQSGNGIPADGVRDVPDVSLNASIDHDGYLMLEWKLREWFETSMLAVRCRRNFGKLAGFADRCAFESKAAAPLGNNVDSNTAWR